MMTDPKADALADLDATSAELTELRKWHREVMGRAGDRVRRADQLGIPRTVIVERSGLSRMTVYDMFEPKQDG